LNWCWAAPVGFGRIADPGGFDVVVTDQSMPEMTGMELARGIPSSRLPVVTAGSA